jgi:hypothetical protein
MPRCSILAVDGAFLPEPTPRVNVPALGTSRGLVMNSIIYIIGLVVVVIAILSFFGLR